MDTPINPDQKTNAISNRTGDSCGDARISLHRDIHRDSSRDPSRDPSHDSSRDPNTVVAPARELSVAAFYHFQSLPSLEVEILAQKLETEGEVRGLRGLIIFGSEGVNGTISGESREKTEGYLTWLSTTLNFPKLKAKHSQAPTWPFLRFRVRVREEIVTLGKPEVVPLSTHSHTHLSPTEWDQQLANPETVCIDTRNWYETRIGKFKNAVDPKTEEFTEFPEFVKNSNIDKSKTVLIYCTGGIRCEKALVEMQNQGFKNVYQLEGGILNYLEQRPNQNFEGECFVFDHRVAVDQQLKPTEIYGLCPHCGQPADQSVNCPRCDDPSMICITCLAKADVMKTCSKNCAYHYRLRPERKGRPQRMGMRYREKRDTNERKL